jgi:H+-transporting ATPase
MAITVGECSAAVSAMTGLTSAKARQLLSEIGPNAVSEEVPPRWKTFVAKFWGLIPWMLEAALVLQIGLGAYVEGAMIGALLLFNATLGRQDFD